MLQGLHILYAHKHTKKPSITQTLRECVELAHRSWFEVAGTNGIIRVDDQVGGDSRTGNFDAYFVPYVGSKQYILGDVNGKDELRQVEGCDHVISLVEDFAEV